MPVGTAVRSTTSSALVGIDFFAHGFNEFLAFVVATVFDHSTLCRGCLCRSGVWRRLLQPSIGGLG